MSKHIKFLLFSFFAYLGISIYASDFPVYKYTDFRNYYGNNWSSRQELFTYCKNVGYTHLMYSNGMENHKESEGMYYYLETPEYFTYDRIINLSQKYPEDKIKEWESICTVIFPEKPFPKNMATGWFFNKDRVSLQLDMQQKKVHEIVIKRILDKIKQIEKKNPKFKFAGYSWDVPQPYGDFNDYRDNQWNNTQVTLKYWTGTDSSPERPGIKHDYKTYFEGYFEFYRTLMQETRKLYPNAKFFVEPYDLYRDWVSYYESDFFKAKGADAKYYMADFITSEGDGDKYLKDERIYKSGLITKDMVGTSSPNTFLEKEVRATCGATAKDGAWACFFLRYGGYNVTPRTESIRDIPTNVKIGKLIPNWENINGTPIEQRTFDGNVYKSPTAYMSKYVYWAKQPQKDRVLCVFNSKKGVVELPENYEIEKIQMLSGVFTPMSLPRKSFLKIDGNKVSIEDTSLVGYPFAIVLKKAEVKSVGE